MGTVYRAERADAAFRRIVAVKVVRRGAHTADILERFHRERETLAALDHPNIAGSWTAAPPRTANPTSSWSMSRA